MAGLPEGFVDPHDVPVVTAVLDSVLRSAGPAGLLDLFGHIPGLRVDPGTAKGFLRAAVPPSAWLGSENRVVLETAAGAGAPAVVLQHVVGGVTLSRETLPPSRSAAVLARLLSQTLAENGGTEEASAALTANRDLYGPL